VIRSRVVALVAVLLAAMSYGLLGSGDKAVAIPTDTGWTQGYNNFPSNVNCFQSPPTNLGCTAWVAGAFLTVHDTTGLGVSIAQAINNWNADRLYANTPYFYASSNTNSNVVISWATLNGGCAVTNTVANYVPPDSRNQRTIVSATIQVVSRNPCGYNNVGDITHELGHSIGLGHTAYTSQIMYPSIQGISAPQARDICGFNRIYTQYSC